MGNRSDTIQLNSPFRLIVTGGNPDPLILQGTKCDGLNDGDTAITRHRESGTDSTSLMPYAGLTTASVATIEGIGYANGINELALQDWRNQVKGKTKVGLGGQYRELTLLPIILDEIGLEVDLAGGNSKPYVKYVLHNCVATKFSLSSWDFNAPEIRKWTVELQFQDMEIITQ